MYVLMGVHLFKKLRLYRGIYIYSILVKNLILWGPLLGVTGTNWPSHN